VSFYSETLGFVKTNSTGKAVYADGSKSWQPAVDQKAAELSLIGSISNS